MLSDWYKTQTIIKFFEYALFTSDNIRGIFHLSHDTSIYLQQIPTQDTGCRHETVLVAGMPSKFDAIFAIPIRPARVTKQRYAPAQHTVTSDNFSTAAKNVSKISRYKHPNVLVSYATG